MRKPIATNSIIFFVGISEIVFLRFTKKIKLKLANKTRHHTRTVADKLMRSPKIAVSPNRRTAR